MKNTKIIYALLCCSLLAGCAEKDKITNTSIESSACSEKITSELTTETTSNAVTEPYTETDPLEEARLSALKMFRNGNKTTFSCKSDGNIVSVYLGDLKFAEIETGETIRNVSCSENSDYNFDGCPDIFIETNQYMGQFKAGEYWLCDPDTLRFSKCEELNVFYGHGVLLTPENNRLILEYDSSYENNSYAKCRLTYKWDGDKLISEKLEKEFNNIKSLDDANNKKYIDEFSFDHDGNTVLEERKIFDWDSEELIGTEKELYYIRVTAEAVEYMKGNKCIQQIPVKGIPDISAYRRLIRGKGQPFLYDNIVEYIDYDFDGNPDLNIISATDDLGYPSETLCYRYDPALGIYCPINEFNVPSNLSVSTNNEKQTVTVKTYERHDKTEYTYTTDYKWVNGTPERISRSEKVEYYDENGDLFSSVENDYRYDENGSEYKYIPFKMPVAID